VTRPTRAALALVLSLLPFAGAACFAPTTPEARVLEVAQEMKMATRFGQVEVAIEHVDAPARADYVARHAIWASELRIVDVELVGVEVQPDNAHADVELAVAWQANDEATVRTTNVRQRYRDDHGAWRLQTETAGRGDGELFARVERRRKDDERAGASGITTPANASGASGDGKRAEPTAKNKKHGAFETRSLGTTEGSYDASDSDPSTP